MFCTTICPISRRSRNLLKARLSGSVLKQVRWAHLAEIAAGLNYAEVTRATNEVLKDALIHRRAKIEEAEIGTMLEERKSIAARLNQKKPS